MQCRAINQTRDYTQEHVSYEASGRNVDAQDTTTLGTGKWNNRPFQKAIAAKGFVERFALSVKGSAGEVGLMAWCSSSKGVANGSTAWEDCRACVVVNNRVTGVEVSGSRVGCRVGCIGGPCTLR